MDRMKFYKPSGELVVIYISGTIKNIFDASRENRVMTRDEAWHYATQAGLTRKKPSVAPVVEVKEEVKPKETLTEILNRRKLNL